MLVPNIVALLSALSLTLGAGVATAVSAQSESPQPPAGSATAAACVAGATGVVRRPGANGACLPGESPFRIVTSAPGPVLIDASGKDVGPFLGNPAGPNLGYTGYQGSGTIYSHAHTLIDGFVYQVNLETGDVTPAYASAYWITTDCSGTPYIGGGQPNTAGAAANMAISIGGSTVYRRSGPAQSKEFVRVGTPDNCRSPGGSWWNPSPPSWGYPLSAAGTAPTPLQGPLAVELR